MVCFASDLLYHHVCIPDVLGPPVPGDPAPPPLGVEGRQAVHAARGGVHATLLCEGTLKGLPSLYMYCFSQISKPGWVHLQIRIYQYKNWIRIK